MAGTVKAFNLPVDYVIYDMSYSNLVLYGATLPSYGGKGEDKDKKGQEHIKADDPKKQDRVGWLISKMK